MSADTKSCRVGRGHSTCVLILSDKSSGSSALQGTLAADSRIRVVPFTHHQENETLYWVKAAAFLGLPQPHMINSVIPMAPEIARRQLQEFLERNLGLSVNVDSAGEWLFDGWLDLCHHLQPVFLEKSPHHLHAQSALDLILRCAARTDDVEFRFIGLIRNPMDCLYSKWRRWRHKPEESQYEWLHAHRNLQVFAELVGERLLMVRYEDLVTNSRVLESIRRHSGLAQSNEVRLSRLNRRSLGLWKHDRTFGFRLAPEVEICARELGYRQDELAGHRSYLWPIRRAAEFTRRRIRRRTSMIGRQLSRRRAQSTDNE